MLPILSKGPFPVAAAIAQRLDDDARLAALAQTDLLDSPPEESFDRLTRLACHSLKVPAALVTLVTNQRQFFKSAIGLPEPIASQRETDLSHSFCSMVVEEGKPVVVSDARTDPSLASHPAIASLGVVAYLGVPLTLNGQTLGAVCGIDHVPRDWSAEDAGCLQDLAKLAAYDITLRDQLRVLAETSNATSHAERLQILGQHAAGITHDLKNVFQALSANIELLRRVLLRGDQAAATKLLDAFGHVLERGAAVSHRVLDMARADDPRPSTADPAITLAPLLERVAEHFAGQHTAIHIEVTYAPDAPAVAAPIHELETVLVNLAENACHALPNGGTITLSASLDIDPAGAPELPLAPGRYCRVTVSDSGPGIPPDVLNRVGEAFFTTKGPSRGTGLGLSLARGFAARARGGLAVESRLGEGTSVHVWLPAA